jgi:hypothetical protein
MALASGPDARRFALLGKQSLCEVDALRQLIDVFAQAL